jgi:hypothetical protein
VAFIAWISGTRASDSDGMPFAPAWSSGLSRRPAAHAAMFGQHAFLNLKIFLETSPWPTG